jgi:LysE type translocator
VLKIVGVAYLIWLAIGALRHGSALTLTGEAVAPQSLMQVFLTGLGVNLLNPKIVMFFLTFLPQFVSANDPHAAEKLTFLGLYFIALGVPTCAVLILLADRFTAAIRRDPALSARHAHGRLSFRRPDGGVRGASHARAQRVGRAAHTGRLGGSAGGGAGRGSDGVSSTSERSPPNTGFQNPALEPATSQ